MIFWLDSKERDLKFARNTLGALALTMAGATTAFAASLSSGAVDVDYLLFDGEANLSHFGATLAASDDLTLLGDAIFSFGIDFTTDTPDATASGFLDVSDDDGAVLVGNLLSMSSVGGAVVLLTGALAGLGALRRRT